MQTALFRHSDVCDPYELYAKMLIEQPIFRDPVSSSWIVYDYSHCRQLLQNDLAQIPRQAPEKEKSLNEYSLQLLRHLVRLSNPPDHALTREAIFRLFGARLPVFIPELVKELLPSSDSPIEIDWMGSLCNQLPTRILAASFGFSRADTDTILTGIQDLIKIMLPVRSDEQTAAVNKAAAEIYTVTERHFTKRLFEKSWERMPFFTDKNSITPVCVSNLVGLFIQSYDAGRGILANSLLQLLKKGDRKELYSCNRDYISRCVLETLRYDPPVHNTRRILTEDIVISNKRLEKDQIVVLMLAAANRDGRQFAHPDIFDPYRDNNKELLTFGNGAHECMARHFSIHMTTETLCYLFQTYDSIELRGRPDYKPLINVRIPKEMLITLKS